MKNIITNEAKQFIIVKVDAKGEPEGVLTRRTSRYGSSIAVSPINLANISIAIRCNEINILQYELDNFLSDRKTYSYKDFKIVEIETKTVITFGKEIAPNTDNEELINNDRELIKMAREWGKQWRKENPNEEKDIRVETPYGYGWEYKINPLANEYYRKKFEELGWTDSNLFHHSAYEDAYNAFVKSIKEI